MRPILAEGRLRRRDARVGGVPTTSRRGPKWNASETDMRI